MLPDLLGHSDTVTSLVSLPNGYLASGSSDFNILIWNVTALSLVRTLTGHTSKVNDMKVLTNIAGAFTYLCWIIALFFLC